MNHHQQQQPSGGRLSPLLPILLIIIILNNTVLMVFCCIYYYGKILESYTCFIGHRIWNFNSKFYFYNFLEETFRNSTFIMLSSKARGS